MRVAYEPLPVARWSALFHVLALERPEVRFVWQRRGFPTRGRHPLEDADVGLFLEPPEHPGLAALTVGVSRMAVVMAVGHRLARYKHELRVTDVLGEPFPGHPDLHPEWRAFWSLDAYRGGPPADVVGTAGADEALDVIASGAAVATFAESLADGLPHPGVISVPLVDGPPVRTRLVWRTAEEQGDLQHLLDIARDMYVEGEAATSRPRVLRARR
jgi:DNA-binding transcriptional LysR family regulator